MYRRQFLLARELVSGLEGWNTLAVGQYWLHVHPDLDVTVVGDSTSSLTLLGYLFDPVRPQSGNREILERLLAASNDFSSLALALKPYVGRYAIFCKMRNCLNLLQDALALREVYYCERENVVICASQPNCLVRFSQPKLVNSSEPQLLEFVRDYLPKVRNGRLWVGDGTPFDAVKHLLPNHYLDVNRREAYRYWPNAELPRLEIEDAVRRCAAFLQGAMKAAAHRHPLMLAVTAGLDSRSLLAASRDIANSIYFFINKHGGLTERSGDIRIPREMLSRVGLPFHIHEAPQAVPEEFKRLFLDNTSYAHEAGLPEIYHIYHLKHSNKLNVLGVGEIGRTKFYDEPAKLSPYYLAYMLKYRNSAFAVRECELWLTRARPVARQYGLNTMTLFWWEVLIGNWGSVGNSESDIAIEEFDPYASHLLYEMLLSVDAQYRTFKDNVLFDKLVRYMWPELMDVPVNPTQGVKAWRDWALHKLGMEKVMRSFKYKVYEMRYATHGQAGSRAGAAHSCKTEQ